MALNQNACRRDLTDREVAGIIGSLIGGLMIQTVNGDSNAVRKAIEWWANQPDALWDQMKKSAVDQVRAIDKVTV